MKSVTTIIAILIAVSSVFASSDPKMVKTECINGKFVPVVTLKAIEVSATPKAVKLTGNFIAASSFANTDAKLVRAVYVNSKIYPLVNLRTVEVTANANPAHEHQNVTGSANVSAPASVVTATIFNGELMPAVNLNTVEVVANRVEQSVINKAAKIASHFISNVLSKISFN